MKTGIILFVVLVFCGCSKDTVKEVIKENPILAAVQTTSVTTINCEPTKLSVVGQITADMGKDVASAGFCYSSTNNPDVSGPHVSFGISNYSFGGNIEGLLPNTTYNLRAYATNTDGTSYGNKITITTNFAIPLLTTRLPIYVSSTTALNLGGTIQTGSSSTPENLYSICYDIMPNPTINSLTNNGGGGGFIKNLQPNTTYHVRSFTDSPCNSSEILYGPDLTFTTLPLGSSPQGNIAICDPSEITQIVPIVSITGKTWMDRNLGSSAVGTQPWDTNSRGGIYQWGRGNDGHASRINREGAGGYDMVNTSTGVLSLNDSPSNAMIIITEYSPFLGYSNGAYYSSQDWRITPNDNLWQGVNGIKNPCPLGYRLPTLAEFQAELTAYNIIDHQTAFDSPLKLTVAGGSFFWTSTINPSGFGSYIIEISPYTLNSKLVGRSAQACVRCIKD